MSTFGPFFFADTAFPPPSLLDEDELDLRGEANPSLPDTDTVWPLTSLTSSSPETKSSASSTALSPSSPDSSQSVSLHRIDGSLISWFPLAALAASVSEAHHCLLSSLDCG